MRSFINCGELKDKIVIQEKQRTIDENGFDKEDFVDVCFLRCKVKTVSTKEFIKAKKELSTNTLKFLCRKRVNINNKMVILFNDIKYNIINIHYIDAFFMEITAESFI